MNKFIYCIIVILSISCSKEEHCGCFDANGKINSTQKTLDEFTELEIYNVFDINIKIDTINKIIITTGKNLIKGINLKVKNNRLIIRNLNRCNWSRKYIGKIKLEIHLKKLTYFNLKGSCNVSCSDTIYGNEIKFDNWADISNVNMIFNCNTLTYAIHAGTGNSNLSGKVGVGYYWNHGYANFNFYELPTNFCYIMSNTTGSCNINVINELGAEIYSNGDILMKGNPSTINLKKAGKGNLIRQ